MTMKQLRFYLSNTDTLHHQSLYELIARKAKEFGLKGATIYSRPLKRNFYSDYQ